jgi:hypothetical protein
MYFAPQRFAVLAKVLHHPLFVVASTSVGEFTKAYPEVRPRLDYLAMTWEILACLDAVHDDDPPEAVRVEMLSRIYEKHHREAVASVA